MGAPLDIQFDMVYADMEKGVNAWLALLAAGRLDSLITARYPLAGFVEAFGEITGRNVMGKIVLDPAEA